MTDKTLDEKASRAVGEFHELIELGLINEGGEFISTLQYPPMIQLPPISEADFLKGYVQPKDGRFILYAHIPFCMKLCNFCHYPNIVPVSDGEKDVYLDHLEKEMGLFLARLGRDRLRPHSMLVGGGTPTFLSPAQLERFMKFYTSRAEMDYPTQFTFDADPLTLIGYEGRERLKILKAHKVDRISMGVQAFSDDMLSRMNRHHTGADTVRAIGQVREMGFKLDIELIYGYPEETEEHWAGAVEQAAACGADEIMIYRLKIIPNAIHAGAVTGLLDKREDVLRSNDRAIRMKAIALALLEKHGFAETIGRSFSRDPKVYSYYRDGFMGRQQDTVSFGFYAMSMLRDRSVQNSYDLKEYYRAIDDGRMPVKTGLIRNRDQQLRRNIALPLKNRELSKAQFLEMTGAGAGDAFGKKIGLLKKYGLLEEDAAFLRPTKKGRFFIDEMTQFFYHPDFLPFPRKKYREGPLNPYIDNVTLP